MVRNAEEAGGALGGGRGRTYCLKRAGSDSQPAGAIALNMMECINVSLAGVASRARKLCFEAAAGKGASPDFRMRPSHCGGNATAFSLRLPGEG